ncbi:alkaline phosphatase family protein [Ferrimonas marina]|uniref:Predicted pyrophosphatase or phosphodiesterase, AlkP superfamily n=1 Tax=Ferrimonas marina TaxID=299255 RepID=A0A1M5Y0K9_9GAMM|nr:nucleotide pyrophosphatase/phosphodiesterase family protein [Ferrimonas marina]SHI05063.1 Predicted pyrophosphatase or phosphodiesterase, AlkP superfamily [Ferrimonas marina]
MTQRLMVVNLVGLSRNLIGPATPNLLALQQRGSSGTIAPVMPAVTCSAQTSYLTGTLPQDHGVVGNGWYHKALCEVRFWHQSNKLVAGEKLWEAMRKQDPNATCANLFWWFNMYSSVDVSVTVRPMYPADGRKIPDIYTHPAELRDSLNAELGAFPLFHFWGPKSDIRSSRWIVDATLRTLDQHSPTLTLVYLPHLDYCLQKFGPGHPQIERELGLIDAEVGRLMARAEQEDIGLVVLSEYGIEAVDTPVHLNRILRQQGWLQVREELGRELLDPGASQAFAVADHQVAHVYVEDAKLRPAVKACLEGLAGVEQVLDQEDQAKAGIDHERSGDLLVIAAPGAWFTYYYWLEEAQAPDFARTVEIHRKPGYDPVELFVDPRLPFPMLSVAWRLLKKRLGQRTLMDVIATDANLVKGSHGRAPSSPELGACYVTSQPGLDGDLAATEVKGFLLAQMFGQQAQRRAS